MKRETAEQALAASSTSTVRDHSLVARAVDVLALELEIEGHGIDRRALDDSAGGRKAHHRAGAPKHALKRRHVREGIGRGGPVRAVRGVRVIGRVLLGEVSRVLEVRRITGVHGLLRTGLHQTTDVAEDAHAQLVKAMFWASAGSTLTSPSHARPRRFASCDRRGSWIPISGVGACHPARRTPTIALRRGSQRSSADQNEPNSGHDEQR